MRNPARSVLMLGASVALLAGCLGDRVSRRDRLLELQARYSRLDEAIGRNDYVGILSLQDAAFTSVQPNGDVFNYRNMADQTRSMVGAIDTVLFIRHEIRRLRILDRETVAVDVCQRFSRMQKLDGRLHHVDTSAWQTDTWVQRSDGWRRSRVENVHGNRWLVDGVRVDPKRGYSPGAAAFQPEDEKPTKCGDDRPPSERGAGSRRDRPGATVAHSKGGQEVARAPRRSLGPRT